jgi:uncharacterized membrane-anchored protein YhcB (DUF1043 family)
MSSLARLCGFFVSATLGMGSICLADGAMDSKYSSLPNLTDDQKSKIAAIEKQAEDQILLILTDDQKAALTAEETPQPAAGTGLYANDAAGMTKGPIKSRDYWQSKFNADQLEQAIKDRQPEGAIALQLISAIQLVDGLLKTYPNHEELKKWHDRFAQVQKQIGDNFDRSAEFKPGCLWNSDTYMQTYVGYNTAKTALADNDQELVFMMSGLALEKVDQADQAGIGEDA